MSQTTDISMYEKGERPAWPLNALPKHWIEALFAKMSAFYGDKFSMMWRGSNIDEVKKAWAVELWKLSRDQLKAGSDALTAFNKPPTLPEFIHHCRQVRAEASAQAAPVIEHLTPADPAVINANMAKQRKIIGSLRMTSAHKGWAQEMLDRGTGKNGTPLTVEVRQHCQDVIDGRVYG